MVRAQDSYPPGAEGSSPDNYRDCSPLRRKALLGPFLISINLVRQPCAKVNITVFYYNYITVCSVRFNLCSLFMFCILHRIIKSI